MTPPRLLFVSYHCSEDPTNGAALATHDQFGLLADRGWPCRVLTGPRLDDPAAPPVGQTLAGRPGARVGHGRAGPVAFAAHKVDRPGYPVEVFEPDPPAANRPPTADEAAAFRWFADRVLADHRPDVVLTYGGDPATRAAVAAARRAGAKVVFRLHNFGYPTADAFRDCHAVVVPSAYSRRYHDARGHRPVELPYALDWRRVVAPDPDPQFVVFVNPEPAKGVALFARLAEVLWRDRPDVRFLVVEGRRRADRLGRYGADLTGVGSITVMKNTPDPRAFYRLAKVVLVPSVWRESFGRVVAEAMANGVPVVASDRGALPETVGAGGVCLPLPGHVTPTAGTPSAAEVRPWADAVLKLWDDPGAWAAGSAAARDRALAWHPDEAVPCWEAFLNALAGR